MGGSPLLCEADLLGLGFFLPLGLRLHSLLPSKDYLLLSDVHGYSLGLSRGTKVNTDAVVLHSHSFPWVQLLSCLESQTLFALSSDARHFFGGQHTAQHVKFN